MRIARLAVLCARQKLGPRVLAGLTCEMSGRKASEVRFDGHVDARFCDTSPIARTSMKESNLGYERDEDTLCVKCTGSLEPHVTSNVTRSVVPSKVCACER